MTKFRIELGKLLENSGRKKNWLMDKMQMNRITFWRKLNSDSLTEVEKNKIRKILGL